MPDTGAAALAPASEPAAIPASIPGPITATPTVLPATGFGTGDTGSVSSVRPGDLGRQIAQVFAPPGGGPATGPAWQFTPSIGVTEELTDNVQGMSGGVPGGVAGAGRGGDLISILQPGLALTGDTQRLQVNLAYSPQIYLYARNGNQDYVGHEFNGRALATLIPQTLFLDLRGLATEQSVFGGVGPNTSTTLSPNDTAQSFSFSASPYLVHRFGSTGTGEVGYSIARTVQSPTNGLSGSNPFISPFGPLPGQVVPSSAINANTTTQNAHAAFVTGEDFGRYSGTALASATHYDGSGVLSGAHRDIFTIDNGYAITRTITLLATAGYENIAYGGTVPVRISDAIWDFGVRLTPNADSTLIVRYGHHDGFDSLLVDGALAPSPRTRLYVRYSEGLTTNQEELQNALATTDLDALGNPVDHATGAPIFDASNFFGVQDSLERLRRTSISGAYLLDRDTFSISVENDKSTVISQASFAATDTLGSNSGTYGALTWAHELSPRLTSNVLFQYGVRTLEGPPATTQDVLVASAGLSYALGPQLNSTLQFSHDQTTGGTSSTVFGGSDRANILLLSVVKTF